MAVHLIHALPGDKLRPQCARYSIPDTDFGDFLDEGEELAKFAPQIIEAIENDLDAKARGLKMPAVTTILENVNLVSHETRERIFDQQIGYILQEQYDDFSKLTTIDSTSGKANSCWPMTAQDPLSAVPTA